MINFFNTILLFFSLGLVAQTKSEVYKITYDKFENGKKTDGNTTIYVYNQMVFLSKPTDKIQQYIDLKSNYNVSTIKIGNTVFKKITPFDSLPVPKKENDARVVLGYNCQHVSFSYFSNRIDIWYTEKAAVKGTPNSNYLPNKNALVLQMV